MSLKQRIESDIKQAMLAKQKGKLRALRSIKSLILLAETEKGNNGEISEEKEMALLMKSAKQRKESAEIFKQQNREDLMANELEELAVIEEYLPKMMSQEEVEEKVKQVINQVGASSPADMGKVMGPVMKDLNGKADGKMISDTVKKLLAS